MKKALSIFAAILFLLTISDLANAQRRGGSRRGGDAANQNGKTRQRGASVSDQQKKNIEVLKTDLNAIKSNSEVTPEQKDALKNSLMTLAEGTTKPDAALVESLANNLSNALADGNLSSAEKARLATDLQKVMNSANIPVAEVNAAIADATAILQASNIDRADVELIVKDLKAIADEAKNRVPTTGNPRFPRRKN